MESKISRPEVLRWITGSVLLLAAFASLAASKLGFVIDDALVPAEEIHDGGTGRDGIPALFYPDFVSAEAAGFLNAKDRVLGIEIDGVARAYPIRILNYHEIVNDAFGGKALVITYCPLCNSGVAFDARAVGQSRLEFGVSGLLYNSDVLLYDRETHSLWSQIDKIAISGSMKGTRLTSLPMAHTTWRDWVARYPQTEVLSDKTGHNRDYRKDPYRDYRRDGALMFPVAEKNSKYRRKSLVLGLEIDGQFKAYPFKELRQGAPVFSDEFAGQQFEVRFDRKNETASVIGEDGNELPSLVAYWFAWYAFHPDAVIFTAD
jgi:hypothetical protein